MAPSQIKNIFVLHEFHYSVECYQFTAVTLSTVNRRAPFVCKLLRQLVNTIKDGQIPMLKATKVHYVYRPSLLL